MAAKGTRIKAKKVSCSICGQVVTKPGLVGHMAWKHGRQSKAPLLPSKGRIRKVEMNEAQRAELYEQRLRIVAEGLVDDTYKQGGQLRPLQRSAYELVMALLGNATLNDVHTAVEKLLTEIKRS